MNPIITYNLEKEKMQVIHSQYISFINDSTLDIFPHIIEIQFLNPY